ncbi:MAG: DUF1576 domain-containing protein [Candidatus Onthomonas sp.]|nr:DUF1576 domain-containing protein [Candidatus Onthomonas sp.]
MRVRRDLQAEQLIRLLFWFFSLAFLAMALLAPDRENMFSGLVKICTSSGQTTKSYFESLYYGGISGAFLNVALVGFSCAVLFLLPGARPDANAVLGYFLTTGFAFWGITALNTWFCFAGVWVYSRIRRESFGQNADFALFSTGLAPLITDLLFRYPGESWHGFTISGILLALMVSCLIGVMLPAGYAHSLVMHKGYNLYSAAIPIGVIAFFLRSLLFQVLGGHLASTEEVGLQESYQLLCNGFCLTVFLLCVLFGFWLNGNSFRGYWALLKEHGHSANFLEKHTPAILLLNLGLYGLFILAYYNLIGATWNAVTLGCVFCMLACCFSGSHPGNVWPILVGYFAASLGAELFFFGLDTVHDNTVFSMAINAQSVVVGACFANGLSPIAGRYGRRFGVIAGMLQYVFVTCVPLLHGGFCLYNGGLTDAFVCFLMVPVLEHFCETKESRVLRGSVRLRRVLTKRVKSGKNT